MEQYKYWHEDSVCMINDEYHIIGSGILSKHDFALLFENEEKKVHIPIESLEQINIYDEVSISSGLIKVLCDKGIRVSVMDRHGIRCGSFDPVMPGTSTRLLLAQSQLYLDAEKRLGIAKAMERAAIGNIRSGLDAYRRVTALPTHEMDIIERGTADIDKAVSINQLMLIEARVREAYYHLFNTIIHKEGFEYTARSRRPPEDPINALISFGNTLLYNEFYRIIGKSMLDDRIGVIHTSEKRNNSLSLDFSDIFKPIVVDRVIFSIINRGMISAENSFEQIDDKGIYMTKECKETFIRSFTAKLDTELTIRGEKKSYRRFMEAEVSNFRHYLDGDVEYRPFIYY